MYKSIASYILFLLTLGVLGISVKWKTRLSRLGLYLLYKIKPCNKAPKFIDTQEVAPESERNSHDPPKLKLGEVGNEVRPHWIWTVYGTNIN